MMRIRRTNTPSKEVSIQLPGSKSLSNRYLILQALYPNLRLSGLSTADDTLTLQSALKNPKEIIDVGHAGTAMRFLTAFAAFAWPGGLPLTQGWTTTITGSERMQNRPIAPLVDALKQLGAKVDYTKKDGFPPIMIRESSLEGGEVVIDESISSQFISALLLVAPKIKNGLILKWSKKPVSRSYIQMTLGCLRSLGIPFSEEENQIHVEYCPKIKDTHIQIEPDWSAASYWYGMVSLNPNLKVSLKGLTWESLQGDAIQKMWFEELGVVTHKNSEGLVLSPVRDRMGKLVMDLSLHPDLAQTLVVVAVAKGLDFKFTGLSTLKVKETDRLVAMKTELQKFGVNVEIGDDWIACVSPETQSPIQTVSTYEDHRMAMSFAIFSNFFEVGIENPDVVKKSYPHFWEDLKKAGYAIEA